MASQDHTEVAVEKKGYQASTVVWTAEENKRRQHVRQMIVTKLYVFLGEIHRSQWVLLTMGFQ